MAWEWSHTEEAYATAYKNVCKLPKKTLLTILREWRHHDGHGFRLDFDGQKTRKDCLADMVWERMVEYRTCTNGGHEAYCCPDGCHTVDM
jgi:hypothetical protein